MFSSLSMGSTEIGGCLILMTAYSGLTVVTYKTNPHILCADTCEIVNLVSCHIQVN